MMNSYLACAHPRDVYLEMQLLPSCLQGYLSWRAYMWMSRLENEYMLSYVRSQGIPAKKQTLQRVPLSSSLQGHLLMHAANVQLKLLLKEWLFLRKWIELILRHHLVVLHAYTTLSVSADWSKEKGFNLIGWLAKLEPIICFFRFSFVTLDEPNVCGSFWSCGLAVFFVLKRNNFLRLEMTEISLIFRISFLSAKQ